jgi:hypothetical protein
VEVGHLDEGTYRITSYYALPDDYTQERPLNFTFEEKEEYKITFPIEVYSFIPSFDAINESFDAINEVGGKRGVSGKGSERRSSNRMFSIKTNVINLESKQDDIREVKKP